MLDRGGMAMRSMAMRTPQPEPMQQSAELLLPSEGEGGSRSQTD